MIIEIALSTAATGVIAGISYALHKSCASDEQTPEASAGARKGIWLRRCLWTTRYALLAAASVILIPLGLLMGIVSLSELKDPRGVRLVK